MTSEPTQPLTEDDFEDLTEDLAEIRERVALRRGFSKDPDTQWQRDEEALLAMADKLLSERSRLRTWDGLMELLDEKWPEDIFPTREDDTARDPGPRILSLLRWVVRLRRELAEMEADRDKYMNWYDHACDEVAEAYRSRNEED